MIEQAFEYMADHPIEGALCEFGVWTGNGLASMSGYASRICPEAPMYGFDSFEGMPATSVELRDNHKIVWAPGSYKADMETVQKRLPHVHFIKGLFSDLKPLSEYGITRVRFARLDCDIYEGYRDALKLLTPCIVPGTVLLFDEGVAPPDARYYESIRDSGARAIAEWQQESGLKLRILNLLWTECLAVIE
jgi:hypothetical protein